VAIHRKRCDKALIASVLDVRGAFVQEEPSLEERDCEMFAIESLENTAAGTGVDEVVISWIDCEGVETFEGV
jgi:hypothetical protein